MVGMWGGGDAPLARAALPGPRRGRRDAMAESN